MTSSPDVQGMTSGDVERLFLGHLPLIDRLVERASRRQCLRGEEVEDFRSFVRLRLIDQDYAVLRKYAGRSSFEGFLAIVVLNLARDYRISQMGKWRPSAAARRKGTEAIQLETLVHRDGFGFEEAIEMLRRNHGVTMSAEELEELAASLPPRPPRRTEEGGDSLAGVDDERYRPRLEERHDVAARANQVIASSLGELDPEDRLILRLRFRDDQSVAGIARMLGFEQRPLYSRFERLLRHLRRSLEKADLARQEVLDLVGWKHAVLEVDYGGADHGKAEPGSSRPSREIETAPQEDS